MTIVPYWRLSGFYFFHYATLGTLLPYWGLYLSDLGFSKTEVGILMSIFISGRVFAPFLFSQWADASEKPNTILKISTVLMLVILIMMTVPTLSFNAVAILLFGIGFLFSGISPQFDALSLNFLKQDPARYSKIRLWGSIGFMLAVALAGYILDKASLAALPWLLGAMIVGNILASFSIPHLQRDYTPEPTPLLPILLRKPILIFLTICFLQQVSHGAYYTYFSIYLAEQGFDNNAIGLLWATGIFAEIILFLYFPSVAKKFTPYQLLLLALIINAARWAVIPFVVDYTSLLFLVQLSHAATFGLFHIAAILYVGSFFPKNMQSRAQAFYAIASFGLGALTGGMLASLLWDPWGSTQVFLASAGVGLIATLMWIFYKPYFTD